MGRDDYTVTIRTERARHKSKSQATGPSLARSVSAAASETHDVKTLAANILAEEIQNAAVSAGSRMPDGRDAYSNAAKADIYSTIADAIEGVEWLKGVEDIERFIEIMKHASSAYRKDN